MVTILMMLKRISVKKENQTITTAQGKYKQTNKYVELIRI